MSGEVEVYHDKCQHCGKEGLLNRRYIHYDIKCDCHSPKHFKIIYLCAECDKLSDTEIEPEDMDIIINGYAFSVKTKRLREIISEAKENGINIDDTKWFENRFKKEFPFVKINY